MQPVFAQNESIDDCAAEIDNDPDTPVDIDDDDDGLIELCYLEDVDAIRHSLDGTSLQRETATLSTGCPTDGCNGYELVRDLDFSNAQSYVSGVVDNDWVLSDDDFTDTTKPGWLPLGNFTAVLEGNGYSISNLQINRDGTNDIGMFAGNTGTIRNLGLREIEVEGNTRVGGLVGRNEGNLINAHVIESRVEGAANNAGLLVGRNESNGLIINSYARGTVLGSRWVGGICGINGGRIINSYANARVRGLREAGGLAGENNQGTISSSYAMGSVHITADDDENRRSVGGLLAVLVGENSSVTNSYSIVEVTADSDDNNIGGLIGDRVDDPPPITANYWDTDTSGQVNSPGGGTAQTTVELQTPTNADAATGIYANWSTTDWDFGSTRTYAALRYAEGNDSNNPACDVNPETPLPPCGALLSGQAIRNQGLSILFFVWGGEQQDNTRVFRNRPFSPLVFDYDINISHATTRIQLRPYSIHNTATISIVKSGENTDYFSEKNSGDLSNLIPLQAGINETLRVMAEGVTYNFNLIRGPQTPVEVVSFGTIPATATVSEGDDIMFRAMFDNGSGNYEYSLQQGDTVLDQGQGTNATASATVPDTFVDVGETMQSIVYTITVDDGFDIASAELVLTVNKVDNGEPQLELTVSPTLLSITSNADDPDGIGTFTYQWQSRDEGHNSWTDLSATNRYTVSGTPPSTIRYRVVVNHTDGQGYNKEYTLGPFPIDVDGDDDGLIDIRYLEDLDVLRYQADGSGYRINPGSDNITVDKIVLGCPADTCTGYELLRDLDFNADDSYVDATSNKSEWTVDDDTDTGWLPIATVAAPFAGTFNGNNNNIFNLQINRDTVDDAYIGLFAASSVEARIENIGILDVEIEGRGSVGSLVAQNEGVITNSYAQGEVKGSQHSVGGLVAFNHSSATSVIVNSYADVMVMSTGALLSAGLVGNNHGKIRNSYAAGNVSGACDVGGLVAENGSGSDIVNSYAAGSVNRSGDCTEDSIRNRAGGLVADNAGLIRNSYAYGLIDGGDGTVGGLVATGTTDMIESSYWDSTVNSGITTNIEAKTRTELQSPTNENAATGIYTNWRIADWDFGSSTQYPILRYTSPTDISIAPVCDDNLNTALPPCGGVLLAQAEKGLSNLLFFVNSNPETANKPFSPSIFSGYTINVVNKTMIELLPYSINPQGASISILKIGDSTDYFMGKRSGELSMPIPIAEGVSTLTIVVGNDPTDTNPVTYSVTVNNPISAIEITSIIGADTVDEGDPVNLTATITGGDINTYRYRWTSDPETLLAGETVTNANLSFNAPIRFVPRDDTDRDVVIKLIVGDGSVETSARKTLTIRKVDSGEPSFTVTVTVSMISIEAIVEGSDPDGDGTIDSYAWQRRGAGDTDWTTIPGETSATYIIPTQDTSDSLYRAQVVSIDGRKNRFTSVVGPYRNRTDIDDDDDGLIDIYYLEDLHAVRYQPDGSGYRASGGATKSTAGCMLVEGTETCSGYELRRDLDFTIAENYINAITNRAMWTVDNFDTDGDNGWQPIGSITNNDCSDPSSRCFAGIFEGNGHSISNLQINRDSTTNAESQDIGLFTGNTGTIRNLGLLLIKIEGYQRVGGLVGRDWGNLINVHVHEGNIVGENNAIGLLVGRNESSGLIINSYVRGTVSSGGRFVGGIGGVTLGRIINSYAISEVSGAGNAGGLVGDIQGSVVNSYAMGSANLTANAGNNRNVGGLASALWVGGRNPSITNSYSTVEVTATNPTGNNLGGLIARKFEDLPVDYSYWDTDTSGQVNSPGGGIAQTKAELQTPTNDNATMGIYTNWSNADWDFGSTQTYAALRHAEGDDSNNPACDLDPETPLPPCGALLSGQAIRNQGLSILFLVINGEQQDNARVFFDQFFSSVVLDYDINIPHGTARIQLRPYSIHNTATISIVKSGENTDYFSEKNSGDLSNPIPLQTGINEKLRIIADGVTYNFNLRVPRTLVEVVSFGTIPPTATVSEGDDIMLEAVFGNGSGDYEYSLQQGNTVLDQGQGTTATVTATVPDTFVEAGETTQNIVYTITVDDGFDIASAELMLTVAKADNGQPSFTETVTSSSISIAVVPGSDADGDGTIDSYTWQRRGAGDTEWTTIAGQTSAMFSIPTQDNGDTLYRVQVMSTDAQRNDFTSLLGPYRNRIDIDDDDDGLIDIYYLEDLDAVRHQTDGSGYGPTDITRGCPSEGCGGYELRRDLDFTSTPSYVNMATNRAMWTVDNFGIAGDTGWNPIGSVAGNNCSDPSSRCFAGVFEGNGHNISNLHINRDGTNEIGMFAGNSNTGTIRNLGLREIEVEGNNRVGGLVGRNEGNLINVYVDQGSVEGEANNAGLLAGVSVSNGLIINGYVHGTVLGSRWVGGICGVNRGTIINSYANTRARGLREVGGLAAENLGTIRNSYAMGSAHITSIDDENRRSVGGLLAVWAGTNAIIANSYSTVTVTADSSANNIGGLIGGIDPNNRPVPANLTASYWDTDTSEQMASPEGGIAQMTAALQMPTNDNAATGIYASWSTDDWNFGNTKQYPALLYNEVDGVDACDADVATPLPRCGSLLPGQREMPVGDNTTPTIILTPSVAQTLPLNSTARIVVLVTDNDFEGGDSVTLTAESSSRTIVSVTPKQIDNITTDTSITFTLTAEQSGEAVITFTATDSKNISTNTKIVVRTNTPPQVSSVPTSVVATVGEAFRLETGSFFSDADNDALTYSIVVDPDNLSYNFSTTGTLTFTPTNAEASTNTTGFTVTVSAADDTGGTAQAIFALLIDAQPTGSVMISRNSTNQWQLEGDPTGISDANGIARRTYRWYRNNSIIGGATGNSYTIPGNGRTAGTRYRLDVTIVDNIGQSATVQSDAITIDNIAPIIRGITITVDPPSPPLEEGDEVTITADATDENNDSLTYSWRVTSGHDGINVSSINARQVSFTLPDYLIKSSTLTQQTLALQLVVRDTAAEAVSTMVSVVVNKKDNGQANIGTLRRDNDNERVLTLTGLVLTGDPDGGGLSSTVAYQWQRCWGSDGTDCSDANNWVNISGAIGNSYTIPASLSGHTIAEGDLFRIGVTYTDMQGYERTVYSGSRDISRSTEIRIRTRVFLEGPLQ